MPKKTVPPGKGAGTTPLVPGFRPGVTAPQGRKGFDPGAIRGPRGTRRGPDVRRPPLPGKSRGR